MEKTEGREEDRDFDSAKKKKKKKEIRVRTACKLSRRWAYRVGGRKGIITIVGSTGTHEGEAVGGIHDDFSFPVLRRLFIGDWSFHRRYHAGLDYNF